MEHEDVLLSIVVPIRDLEKYLERCFDSIRKQTPLFAYEIVCVDNASEDGSAEIIEHAKTGLPITHVFEKTPSVSKARNTGLRAAKGKYVWFIDGDDEIFGEAFSALFRVLKTGESDAFVFGAEVVNHADAYTLPNVDSREAVYEGSCIPAFYNEGAASPFIWNSVYSRRFLAENNLFFPEQCQTGEDVVFQYCCFSKAKKISFFSDKIYVYHYLQNANSLMAKLIYNEELRLKDSVFSVKLIAQKQKTEECRLFGTWLFGFLLLPILRLTDVNKKKELMRLAHNNVLRVGKADFSALPVKNRLKALCFKHSLLLNIYFLYLTLFR